MKTSAPAVRNHRAKARPRKTFRIGQKTAVGASGALVGAMVAGPVGALIGGAIGTAFGAAADLSPGGPVSRAVAKTAGATGEGAKSVEQVARRTFRKTKSAATSTARRARTLAKQTARLTKNAEHSVIARTRAVTKALRGNNTEPRGASPDPIQLNPPFPPS